ncbi:MAG: DUF2927 domain-containing protein [Synechococcales cyanobacterium RU_4_20]|nr:DUF2927 domain-containing protein [Synechococcales cyanobacterium RU_4_20]
MASVIGLGTLAPMGLSLEDISQNAILRSLAKPIASAQAKRLNPGPPKRAALKYFAEIAFTGEFNRVVPMTRKWQEDIRIQVHGSPTRADRATLAQVVEELNGLIDGVELSVVKQDANLGIFFVPEPEFSRHVPSYQPVNYGFFWVRSEASGRIRQAKVLVATNLIRQRERSHLIREELTQALGLTQDSLSYADSIFYQDWTATTQYSALDRALIQMLYQPQILPGMDQARALEILQSP